MQAMLSEKAQWLGFDLIEHSLDLRSNCDTMYLRFEIPHGDRLWKFTRWFNEPLKQLNVSEKDSGEFREMVYNFLIQRGYTLPS
jgi:hypothetical protein